VYEFEALLAYIRLSCMDVGPCIHKKSPTSVQKNCSFTRKELFWRIKGCRVRM